MPDRSMIETGEGAVGEKSASEPVVLVIDDDPLVSVLVRRARTGRLPPAYGG